MSTYTDLHNRVQESINVDYNSRVTPQVVKLHNNENEYWGTFKGTMQVDNIDINGGTLSGVKLRNVEISGATFKDVDGLNLDLDDYVKEADFLTCKQELTAATAAAGEAKLCAATVNTNLTSNVDRLDRRVDGIVNEAERAVTNKLTAFDEIYENKFSALSNSETGLIYSIKRQVETDLGGFERDLSYKDDLTAREQADRILSDNLTGLAQTISNDLTDIISGTSAFISDELTTNVDQLTTTIYDVSSYISGEIDAVSSDLIAETTNRIEQNNALRDKINSVYNDDENTGTVYDVSAELHNQILTEGTTRDRDDQIISGQLTNLWSLHDAEVRNRTFEDKQLSNAISTLCADCQAADAEIIENLNETSTALDNKIDKTSADVLAELEYKRHYILNNGRQGHAAADIYPLVAQDMAVNIFDMEVPDAKVVYLTNDDRCVDIARVNVVDNTVKVKTYAELSTKHEGISKALLGNHLYEFTRASTQQAAINGYTLEYTPSDPTKLLSPGKQFYLHATQLCYYNLILSGTQTIVGKAYSLSCNDQNTVMSGQYDIEAPSTTDIGLFNDFKGVWYDNVASASTSVGAQRITYQNDNTFKLELGVHSVPFFDVVDRNKNKRICRVYQTAGNEDGIQFNEENQITSIRINDIEDDSTRYAYLNTDNNFSTIISTYQKPTNLRTYNRYIEAEIDSDSNQIIFKQYDAARLNKYPFVFTSFDGSDTQMTGYVVPYLYNKTIDEALDYGQTFSKADVDLTDVVTVDRLKKTYTLNKVGKNTWFAHDDVDGASIDVVYSDYSILSVHYTLNNPEIINDVQQQNDFTHVLVVSREAAPNDYSADPDAIIESLTLSAVVDLDNTFVNENYQLGDSDVRDYVDKTYYMSFDIGDMQQTTLVPYDLDVVLDGMNEIVVQLPSKLDYDPNYQVSREFLLVLRFKSETFDEVEVKLVKEDGNPATYYNNKLQKITLPTNQWTTLQVNEVQNGKYLITDLNQNEDRLRFRELADISADHESRIGSLEEVTARHGAAIDALSDAMHFKGDVVLKTNYNDPDAVEEDEHTHLSMLVGTCDRIDPEQTLERGYTFRCVLEDGADPLKTYEFKETSNEDAEVLKLNNNDYIMLTEDGKLSDVNVSNVVVVKDYSSHITNLSTASDDKYFINVADNTATGTNTFEGSTLASALTAAELSAANVVANAQKIETAISVGENIVADTTGLTADNLSAENLSADSFIASNLTASGITAGSAYLSDELSVESLSATSANVNVQLVESAISISNNIVADTTGLTADNLSAENLTVDNLTARIIDASEKVVVAENLSVDENGLSAKNFVATADGISASGLSASNLKVENVAADSTGLSANAISTTTLSASDSIIIDGKLTATDGGLTANGKLSTNNDLDVAGNLSVGSSMLSAKGISADENGLSTGTLEANELSVDAWSKVSAVVDNQTTTLNDELTAIKSNVSTISGVVDGALSGNVELPAHRHTNPDSTVVSLTATVSKLIIIDEATYDRYALTIRNGALNIDKIDHYNGN